MYIIQGVQLMENMKKFSAMGPPAGVWIRAELNDQKLEYTNQKYPTAYVSLSELFNLIQYRSRVYITDTRVTMDKSPSKAIKTHKH